MVFNFIESGIKLFDDTFNTIKGLFAQVADSATVQSLSNVISGIQTDITNLSNRVTNVENSTVSSMVNASPAFTPRLRAGGYRASGTLANYFYIDWSIDTTFENYFRLLIKASSPYYAQVLIKETGTPLQVLFSFNIT